MKLGWTSGGTAAFAAALGEFWGSQLRPGATLVLSFFAVVYSEPAFAELTRCHRAASGARNPPVTHIQGCLAALLTPCQGTGAGGREGGGGQPGLVLHPLFNYMCLAANDSLICGNRPPLHRTEDTSATETGNDRGKHTRTHARARNRRKSGSSEVLHQC